MSRREGIKVPGSDLGTPRLQATEAPCVRMTDVVSVHVTAPTLDEARTLARRLLEAGLIACANLLAGGSLYRWEGRVVEEPEVVMILKTARERLGEVASWVREHHPYEVPCVVGLPVLEGNPAYLDWVRAVTG